MPTVRKVPLKTHRKRTRKRTRKKMRVYTRKYGWKSTTNKIARRTKAYNVKMSRKKYKARNSPPLPANEYCGKFALGNDGKRYLSVPNKYGVCKWIKK